MSSSKKHPGKNQKRLTIRNSTAEFLVFTSQAGEHGIEVRVEDENVWLTQKIIGNLFDVEVNTVKISNSSKRRKKGNFPGY